MTGKLLLGAFAMIIAGCTSVPPAAAEEPVAEHGAGLCDATKVKGLIGKPATAALEAEARRLSGAQAVRTIRPGDMVTMDYREDRLNLELDEAGRVRDVRCG